MPAIDGMFAHASSEQPDLNIVGEKVALGPLRRDLLPVYTRWMNDFDVIRTLGVPLRPMTTQSEDAWLDRAIKDESDCHFTIYERATSRPIGNTSLNGIQHRHRTALFGLVIGEKDCWGKGYGTEVTRLMLDYGFNGLGLHNITLTVIANNERGLRAYTRVGFKLIGRRREAFRVAERAFDVIYMDCLATEFSGWTLRPRLIDA